ncbi:MAG: ATPase, T2SS/T4P/T4SS family [Bacillota bacterium]
MSEKIAKRICRLANERGNGYLSLERGAAGLSCAWGEGQATQFLRLDEKTETSVTETFRRLVGAAENDFFADKRFKIADKGKVISGRATLLPAKEGEKLIISLSSEKPSERRLGALGLEKEQLAAVKSCINRKRGVILISAEEEDGATSTYYSLLREAAKNRITYSIEDFPAQSITDVAQISPRRYGGTGGAIDRLLRTDCEVIGCDSALIDEDFRAIFRAASTGRLIIMTLPYKSGALALSRLKKSGLSSDDIARQLLLVLTQKLFPRPCARCLKPGNPDSEIKQKIIKRWPIAAKQWPRKLYRNIGCSACRQNEAGKRTAAFEAMRFLPDGRLQAGFQPLIISALHKAALGLVDIEDLALWATKDKKI